MRNEVGEKLGSGPWSEQDPRPQQGISLRGLAAVVTQPKMVALLWGVALLHLVWIFAQLPAHERGIDFSVYYSAAAALRASINPYAADLTPLADKYGFDLSTQSHAALEYIAETPAFLLALKPLACLSPRTAYWTWTSISLLALSISMILLLRRAGPGASVLGALMLLYPPLTQQLLYAQSQLLILLLLTLLLVALESDADVIAGFMFAVAGIFRAYPLAIGIYFLITRRWRLLIMAILFFMVIASATLAFLGRSVCMSWIGAALFATQSRFALVPADISLNAFISHFFWYTTGFGRSAGPEIVVRYAVIAVAEVSLLIFSVRATILSKDSRAFSLWIVSAILLSPLAWIHYMVLLFIPFSEMAAAIRFGTCSDRTIRAIVASYLLIVVLSALMRYVRSDSNLYLWIGQGFGLSALLAYLSSYWLATDLAKQENQTGSAGVLAYR